MTFEFLTAPRLKFGAGAFDEVGSMVREWGRRAVVVSGRSPERAARVVERLDEVDIWSCTFAVQTEPDVELVLRGALLARDVGADLIVGIGGGSALDAAKAIAALATNRGDPLDYLEVVGRGQPLAAPPLPIVAIPTTAGTGSEVTKNAVLTVIDRRVKVSLRSPLMLPRLAIVDPLLTVDLPPALTASTGLDALTQLIEPYLSSRANAITDAICLEGLPRAARSLRRAVENGSDLEARTEMAFASVAGGMALANAGLGAVHGFAGALGGLLGAPHGALCAALLPGVLAANLRALTLRAPSHPARSRFEALGPLLTGQSTASASEALRWVEALVEACGIPSLRTYGLTSADTPRVIEQAVQSSSMKGNPIMLTTDELAEILTAAA
jgi:alcohol dehydrogenase class IV